MLSKLDSIKKPTQKIESVGVETLESLRMIDRGAKWDSHEAKQFGSSSETSIDLMLF